MGYEVWGRTKVLSARFAVGFSYYNSPYPKAPQVRAHSPRLLRQSNVVCGLLDFRGFGFFLFCFGGFSLERFER